MSKQQKAFTMAEVLITIGIIGIIAALTIPNLMGAYKKAVTENKLKVTYTILSNVLQSINADYDLAFIPAEIISDGEFSKELSKQVFEHYLAPHLNILHRLENNNFESTNSKGEGKFTYYNSYCAVLINDTALCLTQEPHKGNMYFYVILNPSKQKLVAAKIFFSLP